VESVNKRRQEKVAGAGFKETFRGFSKRTADLVGTPAAFLAAVGLIVVWAFSGPSFHFSDTWQLVINTGTTIITFFDGLPHPKYAESRQPSYSPKAG